MAAVLFPETFQEILMWYGWSFQQKVSLLRKTWKEANSGTDKENPFGKLAQGPWLSFPLFSYLQMLQLHVTPLFCGLMAVLCGCPTPLILCLKFEKFFFPYFTQSKFECFQKDRSLNYHSRKSSQRQTHSKSDSATRGALISSLSFLQTNLLTSSNCLCVNSIYISN